VEADNKDIIPFEDEIVNVINYFSLENLRFDGKLTLLFDIDYTEFSVPILSLQPLVENAVKYAGTDKISDGYIKICSMRSGNEIVLTVKDNGRGFDVGEVGESSQGLRNVTARFEYYLDAKTKINSKPDGGTEIEIRIPADTAESKERVK
jgi:LytS/YehU family sensor histidine kinase